MTKRIKGAKDMFHIDWENVVYYDETSPSSLRHKTNKTYGNMNTLIRAYAGDIAGSLSNNGYYVYGYSGYGVFAVHRIIWILHNKMDVPIDCIVDHINGIKTDNRIENLRLVSEHQNTRNAKKYSNNSTGIVGVYFDTKCCKKGIQRHYWKASWMELNGKQKTKAFSIEKYGMLPAQYMASDYRWKMIAKLNEQGAGYTDRHGT